MRTLLAAVLTIVLAFSAQSYGRVPRVGDALALLKRAEALCSGLDGTIDLAGAHDTFIEAFELHDPMGLARAASLIAASSCGFSPRPETRGDLPQLVSQVESSGLEDPYVDFVLGMAYRHGVGRDKDMAEAVALLEKAAEGGEQVAMYELGRIYYGGIGVETDQKLGIDWYERSAELGNRWALTEVADAYYYGGSKGRGGRNVDLKKAHELFSRAAEAGETGAMTRLGQMYRGGYGVPTNPRLAIEWFEKSAALGNGLAMHFLAYACFNGEGVPQNWDTGIEWMEKSAERGVLASTMFLARRFDVGKRSSRGEWLIEPDLDRATKWYRRAAEQGSREAQGWLIFQERERSRSQSNR